MKQTYWAIFISLLCAHAAIASECKITDQSWSGEPVFCQREGFSSDKIYRCYAEIETNGTRVKVWGNSCWPVTTDCWSSGAGAVEPDCD